MCQNKQNEEFKLLVSTSRQEKNLYTEVSKHHYLDPVMGHMDKAAMREAGKHEGAQAPRGDEWGKKACNSRSQ
jgi:hypothetical protein